MTDHDQIDERDDASSDDSAPPRRRRVKVTDKRRVSTETDAVEAAVAEASAGELTGAASGGTAEGSSGDATVREAEVVPGDATVTSPESTERGGELRGTGASKGTADASHGAEGVDDAKAQAAEYLDHLRRLKAEFDNYRKRVLKEQTRAVELATEPLMSKLLEVLDEFELALIAAERKPEFERFLHGVEMVYAKLKDILRSEGLEQIEAQGKAFDPELHEALLQGDDSGEGEARVSDVLRPGYRLKGRVIRPAGVKVSRG